MSRRQRHTFAASTLLLALAAAACSDTPTGARIDTGAASVDGAGGARPLVLQFEKCAIDPAGIWEGTVSGDISGELRTVLREARVAGDVIHVRFDWFIDAGPQSFVADLAGTLHTRTGRVVMNGTVAAGAHRGARVHEQGQLTDPVNSCFSGTIRLSAIPRAAAENQLP